MSKAAIIAAAITAPFLSLYLFCKKLLPFITITPFIYILSKRE